MGSTLTKEELINHILKQTDEVSKERLTAMRMSDLWLVERKLTLERYRSLRY